MAAGTRFPPPVSTADGVDADQPLRMALVALDDAKAEDILTIDLRGKTSLGDSMVIATGRSDRHVGAIASRVMQAFKDAGSSTLRVEGLPACDWVLIDAGDVIVHVFRPDVRLFYNLEKMWGTDRPHEADERSRRVS